MNAQAAALVVSPTADGQAWQLVEPLTVTLRRATYTIPRGFVSDFASVPRLFWSICPPYGKYTLAAVLHDYLYSGGSFGTTRKEADRAFLEVMLGDGTKTWRAFAMYRMVRWFGGRFWRGAK